MKSGKAKLLFIFFIIILGIITFFVIKQNEEVKQREEEYIAKTNEQNQITEIKIGIAGLDTINPLISNNKNVHDVSKLIYEPLIMLNEEYKAEGVLATEWAKQSDTSYIIYLKENVKWSNGKKFTAYDVKFTIDMLKQYSTSYSYNVEEVSSVEIIDDYSIKINLKNEVPFFEYYLTFPILSKEYYSGEDFLTTSKNSAPIGTGMYKISLVEQTYLTLEKNTNWWNKETELKINKININLYSTIDEVYNSFKLGNIDMINTSNINVKEYIGELGYNEKISSGREHTFLILNNENQILSNQAVREAIIYSIDINSIVNNVLANTVIQSDFPLDNNNWIIKEQDSGSKYNLNQAKSVLLEDGWVYKNSKWQKTENYTTKYLELNLLIKASDATKVAVAENIKTQLENQGIRINILYAGDEDYSKAIEAKSYDICLATMIMSQTPSLESFFGENNYANYYNEQILNMLKEVKNTSDEQILLERYKTLYDTYKSEIPYISLYNNKQTVAYNSELSGNIYGNWYYQFYGIETWYK